MVFTIQLIQVAENEFTINNHNRPIINESSCFQVRSRNSIDYASSCGGLDEASCDSSLVSCCSVYEDPCATLPDDVRLTTGGEGTSEGGSESSSIAGSVSARANRANVKRTIPASTVGKKKTTATEAQKSARVKPAPLVSAATPRSKPRTATPRNILSKAQPVARGDRARSREKSAIREGNNDNTASNSRVSTGFRSGATQMLPRTRTRPIPDSLPSMLTTEINKDLAQRGRGQSGSSCRSRGGSSTRGARTPSSTPSEEVRKPLSTARVSYTGRTETAKASSRSDKTSMSTDNKALDTYATLPRRNRNKMSIAKVGEKVDKSVRSRSGSRDASLNRQVEKKSNAKENSTHKSLPPYPRHKIAEKTRIYHETSVQTGLTGHDIENALSGVPSVVTGPEVVERLHEGCQTEGTWEDMQAMQSDLKRLNEETMQQKEENEKLKAEIVEVNRLLKEEQADHAFARQELDRNAQRVLAMLGTPQSEHAGGYWSI